MEHEIVNRETPEMKQLISGIREVSKRFREIAQTHRPLFGGEIYLAGTRGLRTAFRQPSHLAGLSEQGHYPLHPNRRENPLSTLRHQPIIPRDLSEIKHSQEAFPWCLTTTQKEPAEWSSKRYRAISRTLGIFLLITRYLFAINQVHLRY